MNALTVLSVVYSWQTFFGNRTRSAYILSCFFPLVKSFIKLFCSWYAEDPRYSTSQDTFEMFCTVFRSKLELVVAPFCFSKSRVIPWRYSFRPFSFKWSFMEKRIFRTTWSTVYHQKRFLDQFPTRAFSRNVFVENVLFTKELKCFPHRTTWKSHMAFWTFVLPVRKRSQ